METKWKTNKQKNPPNFALSGDLPYSYSKWGVVWRWKGEIFSKQGWWDLQCLSHGMPWLHKAFTWRTSLHEVDYQWAQVPGIPESPWTIAETWPSHPHPSQQSGIKPGWRTNLDLLSKAAEMKIPLEMFSCIQQFIPASCSKDSAI